MIDTALFGGVRLGRDIADGGEHGSVMRAVTRSRIEQLTSRSFSCVLREQTKPAPMTDRVVAAAGSVALWASPTTSSPEPLGAES